MQYIVFFVFLLLVGCYDSGYHPAYIISHTPSEEEPVAQEGVLREEQQR